jgi:hypothetical protein
MISVQRVVHIYEMMMYKVVSDLGFSKLNNGHPLFGLPKESFRVRVVRHIHKKAILVE